MIALAIRGSLANPCHCLDGCPSHLLPLGFFKVSSYRGFETSKVPSICLSIC